MKRFANLQSTAWFLVGLLALAAFLMHLGEEDTETKPEAISYSPSGSSAFFELARRTGYRVAVDKSVTPRLGKDDVAIVFTFTDSEDLSQLSSSSIEEYKKSLEHFLLDGGRAIVLPIPGNFRSASRALLNTKPVKLHNVAGGSTLDFTQEDSEAVWPSILPSSSAETTAYLWKGASDRGDPTAYIQAALIGKGTAVVLSDGIAATNRFIDQAQNADALCSALAAVAKPGDRLVFTEASFGNGRQRGFFESIGTWAEAAWLQLLFLGILIIVTLGIRFGLPEERRPAQRGTRELLDAIADTYYRAKSSQAAMISALAEADNALRTGLKLPRDASRSERDRLLPDTLSRALARLEAASTDPKTTPASALDLIKKVEAEIALLPGMQRRTFRKRRQAA